MRVKKSFGDAFKKRLGAIDMVRAKSSVCGRLPEAFIATKPTCPGFMSRCIAYSQPACCSAIARVVARSSMP